MGQLSPNFATCSLVTLIYKIESQIWGVPPPKKFGDPKTSKFRTLRFDREYLQMWTRYRRSENGVANCNRSPTCAPNLVNFGPQTAKNSTFISTHSIVKWIDWNCLLCCVICSKSCHPASAGCIDSHSQHHHYLCHCVSHAVFLISLL